METVKPIPAFYRDGSFVLPEKLNLPENARVYLLLVEPISESDLLRFEGEKATAEDYFQFERENNCVPSEDELKYYSRVASNETR